MQVISSILPDLSQHKTTPVFYYSNYKDIETRYKHAFPRMDNTDKQKEYTVLHNSTMKLLLNQTQGYVKMFDLKINSDYLSKSLILTHIPFDLLSYRYFGHLSLLESHTGNVLERAQWPKKYINGKTLMNIPFRLCFLQIFGDDIFFKPYPLRERNEIIDLANRYQWSAVTTDSKIRYCLENLKNKYFKDIIIEMMKDE